MSDKVPKTADEALAITQFRESKMTYSINIKHLFAAWEEKFGRRLKQSDLKQVTGVSQPTLSNWVNAYYHRVDLDVAYRIVEYFDYVLDIRVTLDSIIEKRKKLEA